MARYAFHFTNGGSPQTGLTPSLNAWDALDSADSAHLAGLGTPSISERAAVSSPGWYYFDWSAGYEIVVTIDGGATLPVAERYISFVISDNDSAITEARMATLTSGVPVASINANAITAASVASGAIDSDAMAAGAITSGTFAAGAIDATAIAAGAISSTKIASGAITTGTFAAGAIGATAIAADAIDANALKADAVTEIAAGVWDRTASAHISAGTMGYLANVASGLSQHNFRIKSPTYDSANRLSTCTLRVYGSSADASGDASPIASINVQASYDSDGNMATFLAVT